LTIMVDTKQQFIVHAQGLSAGYNRHTIWQDANLEVKKGQLVGVLGPNGAGKTTLFRLILGLLQPKAGSISVFNARPKRGDLRIGYVPQRRFIDSDMRIEALEIVRLGINGSKWGIGTLSQATSERAKALQILEELGAANFAHRPLGALSGGELQRVLLAQALVSEPDLLLLDEPLANLDIRRQTELVKLINTIVRTRNVAVLLIAHDVNPLLPVLDKVIYIANGQVATGTPNKVITSEVLTKLYSSPVEVLRDTRGRLAVLGAEEAAHPHHD
jgi:zinc/manganese transport system ATP-binding protein